MEPVNVGLDEFTFNQDEFRCLEEVKKASYRMIHDRLQMIPARVAAALAGESNPLEVEKILEAEFHIAFEDLEQMQADSLARFCEGDS